MIRGSSLIQAAYTIDGAKGLTALSMAVNASGGVKLRTTPLVASEEIDQATKKSIACRAGAWFEPCLRHQLSIRSERHYDHEHDFFE